MAENPYVGPRPFERGERAFFFGREREVLELLSLVVAHRVVLLYAASGAGKTSLLNAGLGPLLEDEEGFELLPTARVRALSASEPPKEANAYAFGVLTHLVPETELAGRKPESLAAVLSRREHPIGEDGFPAPRALVVDQLEEVFTVSQERWPEREGFFAQLAEALEADPLLRIVLAIREDYVAHLDPYIHVLPRALRTRIRLERLGREAALHAAIEPARRANRSFAPGVAEKLVDDLLEMRVDTGQRETARVKGEFVEPVQLQVACRGLWSRLPPDAQEITEEHRLVFGDVDQVLSQFYEETVAAAATVARAKEDELRQRFEDAFITPLGTRGTVYSGRATTAGMPTEAIDEMDRRHLIRAEARAGARWYELTHDRLIEPVRASNRASRARRAARWRRRLAVGAGILVAALLTALVMALVLRPRGAPHRSSSEAAALRRRTERARSLSSLALVLHPKGGKVVAGSFAPDAPRLVTLTRSGVGEVWETLAGQRRSRLRPVDRRRPGNASIAVFPPAGYTTSGPAPVLLATIGGSASVLTQQGRPLMTLVAKGETALAARFTDRGPLVILGNSSGNVAIWDGKTITHLPAGRVRSADVSGDGRLIATATGRRVDVWSSAGRRLRTIDVATAPPPLLSAKGTRLALGDAVGKVTEWNTADGSLVGTLPPTDTPARVMAFSTDGHILAVADGSTTVRVLDSGVKPKIVELSGHSAAVNDVDVSPDGAFAVTASDDRTARLWEPATGRLSYVLGGHFGRVNVAKFSPDGGSIVTGAEDGTARVWGTAPDLRVAGLAQVAGGALYVDVANDGNTPSAPTVVRVSAGGAPVQRRLSALGAGQHARLSFASLPGSRSSARVDVDPADTVLELSETNNSLSAAILTVSTPPPLKHKPIHGVAGIRAQIVKAALAAVKNERLIHYSAGPQRMDGVRRNVHLPHLPQFEDTSSFVTWCYFQAGAPDPSRLGYNGFGYSGTLVAHGLPVTKPKPGDIAFYGKSRSAVSYVGIFIGNGRVVAHRYEEGPGNQPAHARTGAPLLEYRSYPR